MLNHRQLADDVAMEIPRFVVLPAEAEPDHRMPDRPVPVSVYVQAPEQFLAALEQFPQGIDQKALAEPARTGQEIEIPRVYEPPDERGLVDIVAVPFPDSPEGLYTDGELATIHD